MNHRFALLLLLVSLLAPVLAACAPAPTPTVAVVPPKPTDFRIVAGTEVKTLEDAGVFRDFTKSTGIDLAVEYKGSVDIKNLVSAYTAKNPGDVDAFWAASSIWLPGTLVQNKTSIMRTYVVFGVDQGISSALGWSTQKGITTEEVISAIKTGRIKLAMPSASQDDAGAVFYLSVLSALKGGDQVITTNDLSNPAITDGVKSLFSGVGRSAASSDALMDVFVQDRLGAKQYSAVVLPESLAIKANQELTAKGAQPIRIFYVNGATGLESFPVGYTDKSSQAKIDQFNTLVKYLKSPDVQDRLKKLGWRTGYVGMTVDNPDPAVFNPAWGIDPQGEIQPITLPKEKVIDQALNQYQGAFRKPSYTVFCLDFSGSMHDNGGEKQLKDAIDLLLDQSRAATVLLQATPQDRTSVLAFNEGAIAVGTVNGNDPVALKKLSGAVSRLDANGGTAMFDCVEKALNSVGSNYLPGEFNYAVIAMTDGQSNRGDGPEDFDRFYKSKGLPVPVFGIGFSDQADFAQLDEFKNTGGEVCDGSKGGESLVLCFRRAKGSN